MVAGELSWVFRQCFGPHSGCSVSPFLVGSGSGNVRHGHVGWEGGLPYVGT